ncbi:MAG: hypothetical protein EBU32_13690 [Opitutaceae bacterium]|uniref:Uncharacterized protein n=1 Tax=viral metagenome TaxID=1070528 RepID=A0A6C0HL21_9ZZZZ|nr:hypothetical protein [Opitutaceae bacterium]
MKSDHGHVGDNYEEETTRRRKEETRMPTCIATTKTGNACRFEAEEGRDKCRTHRNWVPPPPRCVCVTAKGTQCTRDGLTGGTKCHQHRNTERTIDTEIVLAVEQCSHVSRGKRCRRGEVAGNAQHECTVHARIRFRRDDMERRVGIYQQIQDMYWDERRAAGIQMPPANDGHSVIDEVQACSLQVFLSFDLTTTPTDEQIAAAVAVFRPRPDDVVIAEWWAARGEARPEAHPPDSLGAIAASSQNVHTRAVIDQSKRGMDFILAVPVPKGQNTLAELKARWSEASHALIHADIRMWWNQKSCFTTDDYMYRRLLTGVWAYIKAQDDPERRKELEARLMEECREAMRMCCQGHTNRLVNVLSGFVDEIQVEQSKGEILQQRFAAIGEIEDEEARYTRATEVIAELGLNADEAGPWLDAIATP